MDQSEISETTDAAILLRWICQNQSADKTPVGNSEVRVFSVGAPRLSVGKWRVIIERFARSDRGAFRRHDNSAVLLPPPWRCEGQGDLTCVSQYQKDFHPREDRHSEDELPKETLYTED